MAASGSYQLRLVLLGKTGVGKSATGNNILGEKLFKSEVRAESVTKECMAETRMINGQSVTVIDTPGLYDTTMSSDFIERETVRGVQLMAPGPHAFLLVLNVTRHTKEERNTVKKFQEIFGDEVSKHMIVVFTHGDDLEEDNKTIEDFIREAGRDLQDLIRTCRNRYHVFNNRSKDCTQRNEFMKKIYTMLSENNHSYYSYELFTTAQALKQAKEKKKEMKERERIQAQLIAQMNSRHIKIILCSIL